MTFLPVNSQGPFVATSQVYPEDEEQRIIVHTDSYITIANALNLREIGSFDNLEQLTGKQYFNTTNPQQKRFSYRQVYVLGAVAAGATSTIAHGITGITGATVSTEIYGTAVTATDNRPIPYVSVSAINRGIEINVDATNINIINGAGAPAITSGIVVLEYLKN